jgi:hypothetical protein
MAAKTQQSCSHSSQEGGGKKIKKSVPPSSKDVSTYIWLTRTESWLSLTARKLGPVVLSWVTFCLAKMWNPASGEEGKDGEQQILVCLSVTESSKNKATKV